MVMPKDVLAYDSHFFASCLTEGLSPTNLTRVTLHLKVAVTLGSTESELLPVVTDKGGAVAWVAGRRAEVALFNPHRCSVTGWEGYPLEKIWRTPCKSDVL